MIIRVRAEFSSIPFLQLHGGMKFKMFLACVLSVEAKDAAGDGLRSGERNEMIELRGSGISYFRDNGRSACVIAGPACAGSIQRHIDVDVAVIRDAGVRKDELPVAGKLWILGVCQWRNSHGIRFPKSRHGIDLRSRERDRSRRRRRRAKQQKEKKSLHGI